MLYPLFNYTRHKIIMESCFTFSGEIYLFFPEGVPYYRLYRTSRKINSFAELEYVAEKFVYLNPEFDFDLMKRLFLELSDRSSGHVIRTYGSDRVEHMVERVYEKKKVPYCPKLRKIIFNPTKRLTKSEKMKIVGKLIGGKPRLSEEDLMMIITDMRENKIKITITKIAELTDKTKHIVNQSVTEKIRNTITQYNFEIKEEISEKKINQAISEILDAGDKITVRGVKKLCSVRNYELIKRVVHPYLNS